MSAETTDEADASGTVETEEAIDEFFKNEIALCPAYKGRMVGFLQSEVDELINLVREDRDEFRLSLSRLEEFDVELFNRARDAPETVLNLAQYALNNPLFVTGASAWVKNEDDVGVEVEDELPVFLPGDDYDVTFVEPPESMYISIGQANLDAVGKLVAIEGLCKQSSPQSLRIRTAVYRCEACLRGTVAVDATWARDLQDLNVPQKCERCETTGEMEPFHKDFEYDEFQQLKVQESPETAENPANPRDMVVNIAGVPGALGAAQAGDRVTVLGRLEVPRDETKTIVRTFIDARAVTTTEQTFESVELSADDLDRIHELSERDDAYESIVESVAPHIIGRDDEKEAVALLLAGGVTRCESSSRKRGQIHVLFMGEPGTGKSDLLEAAHAISPLSLYTSGTGATGVGLTATADREEIAGESEWVAKAGPAVLADRGVLCIDEMDKISDEDKGKLNDVLMKGKVHVSKASINTTLNARTSALVAANPVGGSFDFDEDFVTQFNLSDDLMDRFDLIFTFRDVPDENVDTEIARNLLSVHVDDDGEEGEEEDSDTIDHDLLQKYLAHARREVEPSFESESDPAFKLLLDFYNKYRLDLYDEYTGDVPVGPRDMNALIRLATASARLRLSEIIEVEDARRACRLVAKMVDSLRTASNGNYDNKGWYRDWQQEQNLTEGRSGEGE